MEASILLAFRPLVFSVRLLSRKAVNIFLALPEYNRYNKGLYEWIGFREKVVTYQNQVREVGKSKFGFKKSFDYAMQGLISFNDCPLRICIQFGFIGLGTALLYLFLEVPYSFLTISSLVKCMRKMGCISVFPTVLLNELPVTFQCFIFMRFAFKLVHNLNTKSVHSSAHSYGAIGFSFVFLLIK
ncbi:stress response protein [Streptococcus sp. DD10]|nr:stress response protein [Streptococcus sp. DD10]